MPVRRLLQFFLLIALVVAPICTMGGGTAMAMPGGLNIGEHHAMTADAGHCADMSGSQDDEDDRQGDIDCLMVCTGMIAPTAAVAQSQAVASVPRNLAVASAAPGLNPGAEPPPPRLS